MRRMALCGLLACSACVVKTGPRPENFPPASTASGIRTTVALSSSRHEGELLEVREDAIVLMTSDRVLLVPISAITSSAFASTRVTIAGGRLPAPEDHQQLRLLSRYPQGIPKAALDKLLASKGQSAVETVR